MVHAEDTMLAFETMVNVKMIFEIVDFDAMALDTFFIG